MFWPFTKRNRDTLEPCFPVGEYCIGDSVEHLQDRLIPLTPVELAALNPQTRFEGEGIWHAPKTIFSGLTWDVILGTVNGVIYKIAAQWNGPRHEAGTAHRGLVVYCTKHYRSERGSLWRTADGNVVLDSVNVGPEASLNVFVTWDEIKNFKQV